MRVSEVGGQHHVVTMRSAGGGRGALDHSGHCLMGGPRSTLSRAEEVGRNWRGRRHVPPPHPLVLQQHVSLPALPRPLGNTCLHLHSLIRNRCNLQLRAPDMPLRGHCHHLPLLLPLSLSLYLYAPLSLPPFSLSLSLSLILSPSCSLSLYFSLSPSLSFSHSLSSPSHTCRLVTGQDQHFSLRHSVWCQCTYDLSLSLLWFCHFQALPLFFSHPVPPQHLLLLLFVKLCSLLKWALAQKCKATHMPVWYTHFGNCLRFYVFLEDSTNLV